MTNVFENYMEHLQKIVDELHVEYPELDVKLVSDTSLHSFGPSEHITIQENEEVKRTVRTTYDVYITCMQYNENFTKIVKEEFVKCIENNIYG